MKKIVIIGAGPTGLGAAYRLNELGYKHWEILEKNSYPGGLSASFVDTKGFTWDIGGHVLFSHFEYFDKVVAKVLKNESFYHLRKSYVRIFNNWVPYPFQNNIRHLPAPILLECLLGLQELSITHKVTTKNFEEWILNTFGKGIAKYFMSPYNFKVWSHPLDIISKDWISERVSVIDFKRVLGNVILGKDDVSWGPNNKFLFPAFGGTGEIFRRITDQFKKNVRFNSQVVRIDIKRKKVLLNNGAVVDYDILINTSPINELVKMLETKNSLTVHSSDKLMYNSAYIVGLGFSKPLFDDKCWMYFPETRSPFYRITYFHNYSPNNVPKGDISKYSSLMCETSFSTFKKEGEKKIIEKTLQGLISESIISKKDLKYIVSKYLITIPFAYPIPTIDRDKHLSTIQSFLERNEIYSRGRFGGWKYEVGNMDHSFMSGVEISDRLVDKCVERVYKLIP